MIKPLSLTKLAAVAGLCLTTAMTAQAKINVVATLPDFAAVARVVGGDYVDVTSLAKPTEDPHFVNARPSFVVKLREADVLVDGGAELEIGWLPPLLQNARNPKIEIGQPGRVQASQGIRLMEVPAQLSRAAGDVHAAGNPHFMVDPIIAKAVAAHIASAFATVDPARAAAYQTNEKQFENTLNAKLQEWGAKLLPYRGQSIVAYHDSWVYFAHRFGFKIDIFLEPKPGIPPSPSHLAEVIAEMKAQKIKPILVEHIRTERSLRKSRRKPAGRSSISRNFPARSRTRTLT
ncbi:MAG TPA: metal ABC transporter substrate-binding protein [Chthoniobacterales bacterium]|nr:metal ABC transporter substrate-binding protein [Chthoniobacterales bacterium]